MHPAFAMPGRLRGFWLLALFSLWAGLAEARELPPAWDVDNDALYPEGESSVPPARRRKKKSGEKTPKTERRSAYAPANGERPWYEPRFALGVGMNVPELLPFEGYVFFGRYFGLRLFYTPPLPFNVRIEMPSDVISTKKDIGVANPDFTIRMKAIYGAHYGAEALVFPFAGSFFLSTGLSHRTMKLSGDAKSPILVCSLVEAAKDPPCGDPSARLETQTQLEIKAQAESSAFLARAALGWFWHVGDFAYIMMNAGATKPMHVTRKVRIEASLDGPGSSDEDVTGALAEVKSQREADLDAKAVKAMQPVDEKLLPILGLAVGVRF